MYLEKNEQWKGENGAFYHETNPEFTLTAEEIIENTSPEFYVYALDNHVSYSDIINVNYYGTTLYAWQLVLLNGGGYVTTIPEKVYISGYCLCYFITSDISYVLHRYLSAESCEREGKTYNQFMGVILVFTSEGEQEAFVTYVKDNLFALKNYINSDKDKYSLHLEKSEEKEVIEKIKIAKALKKMQGDFNELFNK